MSFIAVCGLVLAVMLFLLLIRQFRPELAPPLNLCLTLFLTLSAIAAMIPLLTYLKELEMGKFNVYLPYLMKSMGISLLSTTAADLCRDSGESSIANKLELLGKCEIVLLSLPLLKELLSLAQELMKFS
jgi:stage III sporulation protein AD